MRSQGMIVNQQKTFPIEATHKMDHYEKGRVILEEKIYVSDTCTESHWPENHPINLSKIAFSKIAFLFQPCLYNSW
jgi:hypothetical protein